MASDQTRFDDVAARWPVYEVGGTALLIVIWAAASRNIDPTLLPSPRAVFDAFLSTLTNGDFISDTLATLRNVGAAFVVGSVFGLLLGLIIGTSRAVDLFLGPYLYSVYALPKVALIPLFVVWLGTGPKTIIIVAAIAVALLVAINTVDGVKSIDPIFVRAARNLGATRHQIFVHVILPAASGMVFSGLRLGIGQAFITAVAAEIVLAGYGLGAMMWDAQQMLNTAVVFLCLISLAILGVALTGVLGWLYRIMFPWRTSVTE